jgi:predicted alpha/beta-hydrolase family hydrolase
MATVLLAPGASGSIASMAPWADGLRDRGLEAGVVALPRGRAERAIAPFARQTPDAPGVVIGGRSFGGRVATLLAAGGSRVSGDTREPGPLALRRNPIAAVVALSFPLHAPGRPDPTLARAAHLPAIAVPVLLLSGDRDPFARLDLLREAAARLADGRLVLYPGLGHDLAAVRDDALERIADFVRSIPG